MFFKKIFTCFSLLFCANIPFYTTSCSKSENNDNHNYDCNIVKLFDGSDWYGLNGKFDSSDDYVIQDEKIIYKKLKGINSAHNLVFPNFVLYEGQKLSVYLDDSLFSGFFNLFGSIYLNVFTTNIPNYIFENCINLEKIFLMNKIISVGKRSFYNCTNLKSMEFSKYSEYYYLNSMEIFKFIESIYDEAFVYVEFNTNIEFDKLEILGCSAFSDCTQIKSIAFSNNCFSKNKQNKLENSCFSNCWNIRTVKLNKNIIEIGEECFLGCYNLEKVNWVINTNDNDVIIDKKAFYHCYILKEIYSNLCYFSPRYIGNNAFDSDKEFVINDIDFEHEHNNYLFFLKTTYIGNYAFSSCEKIKSVKFFFSEILIISSYAFYHCIRLSKIDFIDFIDIKPWWDETIVNIFVEINLVGEFYISTKADLELWLSFFERQTSKETVEHWNFIQK